MELQINDFTEEIENKVTKFFELRFPEKDIKFEKECLYFYDWCARLKNRSHRRYSDDKSRIAWNKVFGYNWGLGDNL